MSHLIAAIDESLRPNTYLMCATVASTADRVHIAHSLRALLLPNQRRIHAKSEGNGRRRTLLKAVVTIGGFTCHVVEGNQRRDGGREWCLSALVSHLLTLGVHEFILERADDGTNARDAHALGRLLDPTGQDITWCHELPEREPLLWISDLVLNAYGTGGDLGRLALPLIASRQREY